MNLRIGETVRRIDLLYGLLVASANDAASVIASDVSGGDLTAFVAQMNARAKELGCTDTAPSPASTACTTTATSPRQRTLQKLPLPATPTRPICRPRTPSPIRCPPRTCTEASGPSSPPTSCWTRSMPYHRDYVRGMKTGFTTLAGRCFVTFAQQDGHTYGLVVLGSDMNNIYRECAEILDWAFSSFSDRQAGGHGDSADHHPADQVPHGRKSWSSTPPAASSGYGHADDEVTFEFSVPESTSATVKEGAVLRYGHRLPRRLRDGNGGPCDPQRICV
ncbi:MAG: D-alanyl-D-alanine carboxypeptidase family protein [Faecalibacterium sp.]